MNASWRQDISLRLVALFLAVVMWFAVGRGGSPVALSRPEPSMRRELAVTVGFVGVPTPGLMAVRPAVEPAQVVVIGPASKVDKVSRVVALLDTTRIPSSSRMARPYSVVVRLIPQDSENMTVQGVQVEPGSATVTVWLGRPEMLPPGSRGPRGYR
ncbi:MAG TPA: YbbR-like domain-containing protein [Firmicutes bacterium]|nr:YbbR-like domain-containing protein [Bacillota bacterium]